MTSFLLMALALLGVAWLAAFLPYRLREPPARGRPVLVALRTGTFFLLALLLWNPSVPREEPVPSSHGRWVVVDRSLGMGARNLEGESAWARGVDVALERAGEGARVAIYDGALETVEADDLDGLEPGAPGSELSGAVEGALEAGAASVEVVSDFRIDDVDRLLEVGGVAPEGLRVRPVGEEVRNVGLAGFQAPARVEAGDSVEVELTLHGEGAQEADSMELRVMEAGEVVAREVVPGVVGEGTRSHGLTLPPFQDEGLRRLEAEAELEGDGFSHDDRRVAYVHVEEARRGIALVALDAGWEARQLLPVLEGATDLEGVGYLRLADDRYLPLRSEEPADAASPEAVGASPGPVEPDVVAERLSDARIVVLLGLGGDPPEEVRVALEEAPGLLVFPAEPASGDLLDLSLEGPRTGEWRPTEELPSSRLAGELAGVAFHDLPPLQRVLDATVPQGGEVALRLRAGDGVAPQVPGLLLRAREERREVVVPASGYWRWAARGGEAREAYRRLWSAVGGELLRAGDPEVPVAGPEDRVVARGEPVGWRVEGEAGGDVRLRIVRPEDGDPLGGAEAPPGDPVVDTVVVVDDEGRFVTSALPPGPYAYRLERPGEDEALGVGPFDVDPYAADLERRPRPPDPAVAEAAAEAADPDAGPQEPGAAERAGTPLRTHPLPYLLALAFLCVEWVVRRRVGLR